MIYPKLGGNNLKSEIINLKSEIINLKSEIINFFQKNPTLTGYIFPLLYTYYRKEKSICHQHLRKYLFLE